MSFEDAKAITAYIARQPVEVTNWTTLQAKRYTAARPSWIPAQHELAACLDCALWQLAGRLDGATRAERMASLVSMLAGLDDIARHFDRVHNRPTP